MFSIITQLLPPVVIAIIASLLLFPTIIKLSPVLGLVDAPDYRKFHQSPIPAIGGLVIVLAMAVVTVFSRPMQQFVIGHGAMTVVMLVLMLTGMFDDRYSLSAKGRLFIQVTCAVIMVMDGARLTSLYGLFAVHELPIYIQYLLSIIIIVGVTNAFNLMDGIDGLAGSFALINILVIAGLSIMINQIDWLFFLVPISIILIFFLRYNWRPAKVFMGDSGSLLFGFIMASTGLEFIKVSGEEKSSLTSLCIVLVTGYCMIPVMDALRVFYGRIKKGHSPFAADRTHLHHLLIRHHLLHSKATERLLKLHIGLLIFSAFAINFFSISWVIIIQMVSIIMYMSYLKMMFHFQRWYRFIKRMETTS